MTIEIFRIVLDIVGTTAVVLTVFYLALEIKRSTRATYAQTYQSAVSALADMAAIAGESKDKGSTRS